MRLDLGRSEELRSGPRAAIQRCFWLRELWRQNLQTTDRQTYTHSELRLTIRVQVKAGLPVG